MGLFTEAPFDPPGQVVSAVGGVTATGASPAALRIPKHRFVREHGAAPPVEGTMLIQITTRLGIDAPQATATLVAGGGPGSFTWCPSNPACSAGGLPPGGIGNNGRVVYATGASRFGGTMRMGLRGGGHAAVTLNPLLAGAVGHVPFAGSGTMLRALAVGGGAKDAPTLEVESLMPGYATVPTVAPPPGSPILHPGPFVTTMLGNTATMPSGVKWRFPTVGMGAGQFTTNWGFPHTTGTVIVQQASGSDGDDFFTVMGSDARTPLGAGNLSVVAGGLARRNSLGGASVYAQFDRVSMTLGPPVPSLSPAGLAAAAALVLLAVAYALRRRIAV
jgi:hypothetical protein